MFSKRLNWPQSLTFAIVLFLYSVYLFSFSGKFHVMDELAVFTAGQNLAGYGRADINQLIWTNHWTPNPPGIWGQDGNLYTKKPPGISFITAPLIWLGHAFPGLNAVHIGLLTNALVTALTAGLLFIWLADLGFWRKTALWTALGYGLCTFAWVYARMFWESSLLALSFLAAGWAAYRAIHPGQNTTTVSPSWLWLMLCGLAAAVGLTLRFEAALAVGLIGLYLAISQWRILSRTHQVNRKSQIANQLALYLAPSLLTGLGLLYFNLIRYGSLIETGYNEEILFSQPWVGALGLLFSPGRGLFIYAPLTLLLFWGVRPVWQRLPRPYFWLIAALCVCFWLFYGAWFAWGGTWGWGPRFLLPILPLLMLFVAEPIERTMKRENEGTNLPAGESPHSSRFTFYVLRPASILGVFTFSLVVLSLIINLLGILVDFNEHFLRLGSNDNFVFNWAAFPPLAHWQILQEGLVDLIWLHPQKGGLDIEWPVFLPALLLFVLATINLVITCRGQRETENSTLDPQRPKLHTSRFIFHAFVLIIAAGLTFMVMRGTARLTLADEQAQLDLPVLETLAASARPGDALLMAMPPFGDVQEISTQLMAYLKPTLPTYAWIESEPRSIQPTERERVKQALQTEAKRVWLFERWLTRDDPTSITAARLGQDAFPVEEQWFERSGKLSLYALADDPKLSPSNIPVNVPFQGGVSLVDFTVWSDKLILTPKEILNLRLTWQAAAANELAGQNAPDGAVIVFVQLLDATGQKVAQNDRLLVDLQNFKQSPLLPGQTVRQGYGLRLPDNLTPGSYSLIVGLYHAATGQRLHRADNSPDDFLYLTSLVVEERCCE